MKQASEGRGEREISNDIINKMAKQAKKENVDVSTWLMGDALYEQVFSEKYARIKTQVHHSKSRR